MLVLLSSPLASSDPFLVLRTSTAQAQAQLRATFGISVLCSPILFSSLLLCSDAVTNRICFKCSRSALLLSPNVTLLIKLSEASRFELALCDDAMRLFSRFLLFFPAQKAYDGFNLRSSFVLI